MRQSGGFVLVVSVLVGSVGAGAIASGWSAGFSRPPVVQESSNAPWQVGSCYRVFRIGNEPPDMFKVVASPEGSWVRVEADPRAPWVPGARPTARVWLNINSVFVVQEWPCSPLQ
jgi:hypothetical protein